MPEGEKAKYTAGHKRKAAHIEQGYEDRAVPADDPHGNRAARAEAARRGWETRRKRQS